MTHSMLYAKIHRARVTDANMNYVGSISIDTQLLKASNMRVGQKVDVLNINNGARFSTYIIEGGKNEICLNGAAARLVQKDDLVIIVAYALFDEKELEKYEPKIVFVDENNNIKNVTTTIKG